ncbi:ABC transporter permease [Flavobacteriales bacterium]|nr:ABC transporter permease [Flavobacteriales bacterium]
MSKIGLIIKREYGSRVKKKSFIIMTLLGPILIAAFYASAIYMGIQESGSMQVLLLDETHLANSKDFPTSENFEFATFNGTTVDDLKNELQEKNSIDQIGLYLPGNLIKVNEAKIFFSEPLSANKQAELKETVNDFAEKLKVEKAGFDLKAYSKIQTRMNIAVIDVNTNEESITEIKSTIGFLFSIIIYVFIFMYGVQVMRGVIEEKTSRIIEVMVSSVKPFQLMMGKIVGIALVGLTQFLMWIILSSVFMLFIQGALLPDLFDPSAIASQSQDLMQSQNLMQSQELIDAGENINSTKVNDLLRALINIPWVLLVSLFIFYFLGGYLLYASLFAAVGAAVDSESDTQQFMVPITLPLVFAFVISSMAINNPGGEAIVWFSHVPFTSPIVMLVRVAMGDVAWWEILTSMFILIVSFILTTKLASKIYRIGILMYGKKVTYKELFKWLKYK